MQDHRKYLRPETIATISNIELRARLVVEGFMTGLHKSPYHGFSVEFSEHRQYRPGDEIRYVDWKIFGRTNRYYIKQFEEETNLRSVIAIDSSASMKYASKGNISKYAYSSYLAAALAMLMMNQRDAVGLALYNNELKKFLPPKSKQSYLAEILKAIDQSEPSEATGTSEALSSLAERLKRRGLVVIFSDFFDTPASIESALKRFRHKEHEIIVFQVLDPREIDFNFGFSANFIDLETREEIITQPFQIKSSYAKAMQDFTENLNKTCNEQKIDYFLVDTSQPFDKALRGYLSKRVMKQ